jgi:hypothetical protein
MNMSFSFARLPRCLSSIAIALYAGYVAAEAPTTAVVVNHNHAHQLAASKDPMFRSFPKGTMPQGGTWLGLYCVKSDCEIREATVAVMSGTMANCSDREKYAETVYAADNPVAVFNGVNLPIGRVATVLLARKEPGASAHYLQLRKAGQWQARLIGKQLEISWLRLPRPKAPDEYMYRYYLVAGTTKQFIFSSFGRIDAEKGGTVAPFVHWAGDIDGDGKTDLLIEIPYAMEEGDDAQCQLAYRLYLSSQAADGEVLHKAAQTAGTQPACRCRNAQQDR